MGKTILKTMGAVFIALLCFVIPVQAVQFTAEITNGTHGIHFTPLLVTAHDGSTHLFLVGTAASSSLRAMAECGNISLLVADLAGEDADTIANPAGGILAPGQSTTATIDTTQTHLSVVGMLLPTNDGFVGLDALEIPTTPGTYTYYLNGYDAGTEANSELIDSSGCAVGMPGIPAAPGGDGGTGGSGVASTDSNVTVQIHRGNLGDTDPTGGASDLDSTIHRWLNPVAILVITIQ